MNTTLQSRINTCYLLAEQGKTNVAQTGLLLVVSEFCSLPPEERSEAVLRNIEQAAHRVGINVAFEYAELFYVREDRRAAREWLSYARMHAKGVSLDIRDQISTLKRKYQDRIPLLF